jgi:hypothetical protein
MTIARNVSYRPLAGLVSVDSLGAGFAGAHPLGRFEDGEHARVDVFPNAYMEIGIGSRIDLSLRDQGFVCPSSTDTVSQELVATCRRGA